MPVIVDRREGKPTGYFSTKAPSLLENITLLGQIIIDLPYNKDRGIRIDLSRCKALTGFPERYPPVFIVYLFTLVIALLRVTAG